MGRGARKAGLSSMKLRNGPNPMLKLLDPAARHFAAATFLGMIFLADPLFAQNNSPATTLAQAEATQAAPKADAGRPAGRAKGSRTDRAEARIKQLHDQLHITAAQEPQWNAVAQAMRDDAKSMQSVLPTRRQNRSKITAVHHLRHHHYVP